MVAFLPENNISLKIMDTLSATRQDLKCLSRVVLSVYNKNVFTSVYLAV